MIDIIGLKHFLDPRHPGLIKGLDVLQGVLFINETDTLVEKVFQSLFLFIKFFQMLSHTLIFITWSRRIVHSDIIMFRVLIPLHKAIDFGYPYFLTQITDSAIDLVCFNNICDSFLHSYPNIFLIQLLVISLCLVYKFLSLELDVVV